MSECTPTTSSATGQSPKLEAISPSSSSAHVSLIGFFFQSQKPAFGYQLKSSVALSCPFE
jgi:hypothetical protein